MTISHKSKHALAHNPVTALLGIYPRERKTYNHTKTYTQMFTAPLLLTAKNWKQPDNSFHEKTGKSGGIQPYRGTIHSNKKEQTIDPSNNLGESEWKKSFS